MIEAANGAIYTGITTDVARRLRQHQTGRNGARFFQLSPAKTVRFIEIHSDRSSASQREAAIKRLSRAEKLRLLQTQAAAPGAKSAC